MSTKAIQGKLWSVAPKYWSRYFEPWFLPMYREVLNQLQLTRQDVVLDAGCGSGMFTSMVDQTGAQVTAVDAAPGLLDIARRRSPGVNFLEEDLAALPFKNASFDVVTGFNSFQYAGDFEVAVREAHRVLRPGGRLVIGIWDKPEFTQAATVLKALNDLLPAPAPGSQDPFALSADGRIESILESAGMKIKLRKAVACPFNYASLEDGVRSFMGTGPAAIAMNMVEKTKVEATLAQAISVYHVTDHFHFLQNSFLVFIAEKQ